MPALLSIVLGDTEVDVAGLSDVEELKGPLVPLPGDPLPGDDEI